ncbi:MAG TPA: hypothetical protein PLI17_12120 [Denitromonas sp.]|nr:hypothetical protein [Denitromonas sp.]
MRSVLFRAALKLVRRAVGAAVIDQHHQVVGYAENFSRGEHGRIRASGILRREVVGQLTIFLSPMEVDKTRRDILVVKAAAIRAILISDLAAWTECGFDG